MELRLRRHGGRSDGCRPRLRKRGLVHPALAHRPRRRPTGSARPTSWISTGTSRRRRRRAQPRTSGAPNEADGQAARARLRHARRSGRACRATVESAQGSFADLTANGNVSNTALQQASVAAALSGGPDQRGREPGARLRGRARGQPEETGRTRASRAARRVARKPAAGRRNGGDDAGRRFAES